MSSSSVYAGLEILSDRMTVMSSFSGGEHILGGWTPLSPPARHLSWLPVGAFDSLPVAALLITAIDLSFSAHVLFRSSKTCSSRRKTLHTPHVQFEHTLCGLGYPIDAAAIAMAHTNSRATIENIPRRVTEAVAL